MTPQDSGGGSAELLIETAGALATVTLNRPQARNALTFEMYDGLAAFCRGIDPDGAVKAVIITGAGDRAFAAGTDIAQFRDFNTAEDALAYERRIEAVLDAMRPAPCPRSRLSRGHAPVAAPGLPPPATSASRRGARNSAFRSPGRSAIAFRWRIMRGSPR
jgi:hypothetical protein